MILILHIAIALSSVGFTGYVFLHPSKKRLMISYLWVATTIITGTYLIIMAPAHMVSACMTGLVYLGFVFSGILTARHKLAKAENK